ncbi:MAG TPA: PilN domain-containing protein [Candidatus Polarisedimenticolia bacterium]|nr:PilN domain-containing protein [Candidatus Polarisedimenticolia bacterium]
MIKINLIAEAQKGKAREKAPRLEGAASALGQNVLMVGVVVLALMVVGWRWYRLAGEHRTLVSEISRAEQERERLQAIIKKGEDYKAKKDLLQRKIALVSQLKRNQSGPVHLLDEVSKQLPDFLWLDNMNEAGWTVQISGKATTYNAVSNFYNNLNGSRYFTNVVLGPITAIPQGVTFSLNCQFIPQPTAPTAEGATEAPAADAAPAATPAGT